MLLSLLLADSHSNPLPSLIIFMLIPVAMYFLLVRPQRKRQRAAVSLQQSVEVGDEVMTTSGLYGFVTGFEGDLAWLEIDDNVQIRIARQAIQRKVDTAKGESAVPNDDGSKSKQTKIDDVIVSDDDAKSWLESGLKPLGDLDQLLGFVVTTPDPGAGNAGSAIGNGGPKAGSAGANGSEQASNYLGKGQVAPDENDPASLLIRWSGVRVPVDPPPRNQ